MNSTRNSIIDLSAFDWTTLILCLLLMTCGFLMIFASEYNPDNFGGFFNFQNNYGKQIIWMASGIFLMVLIQFFEGKFFQNFSFVFLGISSLLLFAVLFTKPINGATSWFDLGGFRFQPSEFAKIATALALANLLSMPDVKMQEFTGKTQALFVLGVPTFLILLQNDTGSTLVYLSFFLLLFRAGFPAGLYLVTIALLMLSIASLMVDEIWGLYFFLITIANIILFRFWNKDERWLIVIILLNILFWYFNHNHLYNLLLSSFLLIILLVLNLIKRNWQIVILTTISLSISLIYSLSVNYIVNNLLKPHQQERIWVWLRPEKCDPLGSLYNLEQSKYAIGSGGFWGKGFLEGERTKLDYVPEQSTDFIFCTIGEEWGFVGNFILISLFIALLLRIIYVAERQRLSFSKYYAYAVASILLFHIFVNIGMTMGVMPVIGIPLPFISYGGSSMISFSLMIGILLKLDSERTSALRS